MKILLTMAFCCLLSHSSRLAIAQQWLPKELQAKVVFPDGLEEVVDEYFDALLKADRHSLAQHLDKSIVEKKCHLLVKRLKQLRAQEDFALEERIFDRKLSEVEFSELTSAAVFAAALCIGREKDLSREPGDRVSSWPMSHANANRKIVGIIEVTCAPKTDSSKVRKIG